MSDLVYDSMASSCSGLQSFTTPLLRVNWNLGNTCNYSCSYCSKACHDGSFPWPSIQKAVDTVQAIDRIYKKPPLHQK